jgi:hypothetical protein
MKTLTISALAVTLAVLGPVAAKSQERSGSSDTPAAQSSDRSARHEHGWHRDRHGRRGGERSERGEHRGRHHDGDRFRQGRRGGDMMDRMRVFDLDKDGAVTQAEVDRYRQDQIVKFDANKDGTLSLEEYQALWLDGMRERMVRAFQEHDRDGNGQVTAEEFNRRFEGIVARFDRDRDGRLSPDDRRNRR